MGTDDELALSNAVLSELPDTITLKCKNHKRDNVKEKLQAMKISTACEGEILKDIFVASVAISCSFGGSIQEADCQHQ